MYSYTWDAETGGLLLNSSPLSFSKEPRPVYYKELDILGFDRYWNYAKNDSYPYMWAEANNYFYRGRQVAKTKGGSLYTPPEIVIMDEPEPDGQPLRFVDIPAMVEKNRDLLEKLAAETIKKIYNIYVEYMDRVDVFYVAFSGGKDMFRLPTLILQSSSFATRKKSMQIRSLLLYALRKMMQKVWFWARKYMTPLLLAPTT